MTGGAELDLFEQSVTRALARHHGGDLDGELAALGWADALTAEPAVAVPVLFRAQGAGNSTSSALNMVLAAALTDDPTAGPVTLPPLGSAAAPGQMAGGHVEVDGLLTGIPNRALPLLVATDGGPVVSVAADRLELVRVGGIDPAYGLHRVTGRSPAGAVVADDGAWTRAVHHGWLALGAELTGASRRMLDLACGHAVERVQFGQPIARFQAVRHRLAETLIAVEAAEAVLADGWEAPGGALPMAGKALAGRAARTAGRHCQQVLAGIGFTAEHPFHRYLRRTILIDQLLGSTATLTDQLGAVLLGTGRLADMPVL